MGANIRARETYEEWKLRRNAARGMGVSRPVPQKTLPELLEETGLSRGEDVDLRDVMPAEGLREYWYPALPASKVGRHKPVYWRMLSDDIALFRGADGEVKAVSDVCPHRGASLSAGKSFYEGTITCPYHGATFDGEGECLAFLTEGPDSKMAGAIRVRHYPTRTLRGWVWMWMGDGEPAPIEEDVPPEFFEDRASTVVMSTYTYWKTNWLVSLENTGDSHNAGLFAHRNSVMQLTSKYFSRARTPLGPRATTINDRAVVAKMTFKGGYYADESGEEPFQLEYPALAGTWPRTKWRQRVWKLFQPWYTHVVRAEWRRKKITGYDLPDEWGGSQPGPGGHHLPSAVRINLHYWVYSRFSVPIGPNECRVVYFHTRTLRTPVMRALFKVWWYAYLNWWYSYNFSSQDNAVAGPCRYWTEENLSASDSAIPVLRKLIAFKSRDAKRAKVQREGVDRPVSVRTSGEAAPVPVS